MLTPTTFLTSLLPSFSSLPLPSLPQSLQRRLLSFLLRKSLGRFVRGGLDADAITADLGNGVVRVRGVEVEREAVESALEGMEVSFESGTIGVVEARVGWPLSLGSSLEVELDEVVVVLKVLNPTLASSVSTFGRDRREEGMEDSLLSIVAVAEEFVREELTSLEDNQLRESLALPVDESVYLPGGFHGGGSGGREEGTGVEDVEGAEVTMLAGLIDRILARLSVRVRKIRVRLILEEEEEEGSGSVEVELRIDEVAYTDSTNDILFQSDSAKKTMVRTIKISKPELCIRTSKSDISTPTDDSTTETTRSRSSSESSGSSEEYTPENDMMMSQSIADLRTSFVSGASRGASMYASANTGSVGGAGFMSIVEEAGSPFVDPEASDVDAALDDSKATTPEEVERSFDTILSFGADDIVVVLSSPEISSSQKRRELHLSSTITGPISILLLPHQVRSLLRLAHILNSNSPPSTSLPLPPSSAPSSTTLTASILVKALNLVVVYEPTSIHATSLTSFWSHPSTYQLSAPHLRLRLDYLTASTDRRPSGISSTLSLRSFLLHESTTWDEKHEGRSLPIVLSDPNLPRQYAHERASKRLPTFESVDWVENTSAEGRGWKIKSKVKRSSGGKEEGGLIPFAMVLTLQQGHASLVLGPIHAFVDLTLIERLEPFIASISHSLPPSPQPIIPSTPSTPRATTVHLPFPVLAADILDDLAVDPASSSLLLPALRIECALARVEIRCPPPVTGKRGLWEGTRSGIAILDVHELLFDISDSQTMQLNMDETFAFFLPSRSTQAIAFLALSSPSPLSVDTPPTISITSHPLPSLSQSLESSLQNSILVSLPTIHSSFSKSTIDSLQLFADDLSQFSERRRVGEEEDGETGNRMVGSRYFGVKSFMKRRGGSESEEGGSVGENGRSASEVRVRVEEVAVELWMGEGERMRRLEGVMESLDVKVESLRNSKNDSRISVVVQDIEIADATSPIPLIIFDRTLPPNLTTDPGPLLRATVTSSVESETGLKESKIQLVLANFTYYLTSDLSWISELSAFVKAPAGAFETVVPNELTRVRIRILDGSVHAQSPTLGSQLIVALGEVKIATNLMPDIPRSLATVEMIDIRALAVDSVGDLQEGTGEAATGVQYWKSKGFVQLLELERMALQIRQGNGLVLPDLEMLVSDTKLRVSVCADSVGTIGDLISDFVAAQPPSSPSTSSVPSQSGQARTAPTDVLASVDLGAFHHAPALDDQLEYLDDDVPSNFDYLADALASGPTVSSTGRRASFTPDGIGSIVSDIEGETIRMLDPRGLQIVDDFLSVPRIDPNEALNSASLVRCRLVRCDVTVHLHEGYDWSSTRKAIEEQAKVVRRRLERIRQLLASGQAPDASAEDASILMFGSIQLGLPPGASELPSGQLLAAINEELDDEDGDASSWQHLPGQPATRRTSSTSGKTRKLLTRSKSFAIEVNLQSIKADFDSYSPTSQVASKTSVDVHSFDIIDNVHTSTWRKFLTELRPSDGGTVRASGASMLRFELNKVRPVGKIASSQDEIVMRIKISPLRLYIDQDALDFLKAFGAFKDTPTAPRVDAEPTSSPTEPFFQRVEIMPVKIKLDYKPKRVDYRALRQGNTAELMNFFHFDGSEITLRHLVVSGISGSTRLSDLVQDIWTPDVKSNQLADVLSGIAPVRSVVNFGSGVANLVLLPFEQYRKDGRLVRGFQKGATAFARSTTLEALSVGARLATGTQVILEQAEAVLGGMSSDQQLSPQAGPSQVSTDDARVDPISRYAQQPGDLREGFDAAYKSLGENIRSAAQTILADVYERSATEGPVLAVVRAVPIAILKPMIGASEAVSKTFFGLRNSLDPDAQAEAADKYKSRAPPP